MIVVDQNVLRKIHNAATLQSVSVVNGFAYTISTMSRSSERYSISLFHLVAGWNSAAAFVAPSRTPRFQMGAMCREIATPSSGGFPRLKGASWASA
jgi:hypothetical protein